MLRYHLAMIRKAQDHVDQAARSLEASGERPKAFFPHSPMHKAVTADHIVPESPVLGEMRDVIERWSEARDERDGDGARWNGRTIAVFSAIGRMDSVRASFVKI